MSKIKFLLVAALIIMSQTLCFAGTNNQFANAERGDWFPVARTWGADDRGSIQVEMIFSLIEEADLTWLDMAIAASPAVILNTAKETNTDSQELSFASDVISLVGSTATVDLSGYALDADIPTSGVDFDPVGTDNGTDDQTGAEVALDTTNFDNNLSGTDTTVQAMAETLDELTASGDQFTAEADTIAGFNSSGIATTYGTGDSLPISFWLQDLGDVDATNLADNTVPVYNSTAGVFEFEAQSAGGSLSITEQATDPATDDLSDGDIVISEATDTLFIGTESGVYSFVADTYTAYTPTYSLTMAITDPTGTGSTFTVDSIAADVGDTPKTWTGLSSSTQAVTFAANTTEASSCTGTGVTGSGPNWIVDVSSADVTDMACTVSASSTPVVDTNSDNLPNGGTASAGTVALSTTGATGGYFQIATANTGKHFYGMDITLSSVEAVGTLTCRIDDDADMGSEYIATADVEVDSGDGTYQIVWDDSSTALDDATVYWWGCRDVDATISGAITYSNDVADSGYDYASGDWVLDHTDNADRDLEVQFYVQ